MASRKNSSGNRLDMGWQYGIAIDKNFRKVQCKYCQKIISGGIFVSNSIWFTLVRMLSHVNKF
jgi:hypothetical protein